MLRSLFLVTSNLSFINARSLDAYELAPILFALDRLKNSLSIILDLALVRTLDSIGF